MQPNLLSNTELSEFLSALETLPNAQRSAHALRYASKCIEFAAYESAQGQAADDSATLIRLAAQLEAIAKDWTRALN